MIVFDLKCPGGHVFEAWFSSSSAFEDQKARNLLMCPTCGNTEIGKAVMAPNVAAKGNQRTSLVAPVSPPGVPSAPAMLASADPAAAALMEVMSKIAAIQAEAIKSSTWVGEDFEAKARAMDAGELDHAPIHGQATAEQAKAMVEDGIGVMPLLIPVIPPDKRN